ncbi:hypothetical protein BJ878DRAFT_502464 [Calycina marina]|uniref:Uncharacterized protein n=1 Tax=Calycina marina TaxID=1763456 RepID=A0A9P8CG07_9HELO|nr:hypothetical protein BJ878DRAFT_502464 [Calycina marina]
MPTGQYMDEFPSGKQTTNKLPMYHSADGLHKVTSNDSNVSPPAAQTNGTQLDMSNAHLYSTELQTTRFLSRLQHPNMNKGAKMKLVASRLPQELYKPRPLTAEEHQEFGYTKMEDLPFYVESGTGTRAIALPLAQYFSPSATEKLRLWPILEEIRRIAALRSFMEFMRDAQNPEHKERRGTGFDLTSVAIPGHMPGGVRLSMALLKACQPGYKQFKAMIGRLVVLLAQADEIVLQNSFSKETVEMLTNFEKQRIAEASITSGHSMFGATQINYFPQSKTNTESLKARGGIHPDPHDDPPRLSNLYFFQANCDDNFSSGRFSLPATQASCSAEELGILRFSARHPHFSSAMGYVDKESLEDPNAEIFPNTAKVPRLHGDKYFDGKIHIVRYARMDYMHARTKEISRDFFDEDKAVPHFGGIDRMMEWKMLHYIRENMEALQQDVASQATPNLADVIRKQFGWADEAGTHIYPSLRIAQASLDLKGKGYAGWKKLHEDYNWTDCGTRSLQENRDPNSIDEKKKITVAKWLAHKKAGSPQVQCQKTRNNGKRCKNKTFNLNYCTVHSKDVLVKNREGGCSNEQNGWK